MNEEQKNKYAFELMVKNNPDEAVKQLIMLNKLKNKYNDLKIKCAILEYSRNNALVYINNILIPYGDDWYWDDSSIRDYVVELANMLKEGEDNE